MLESHIAQCPQLSLLRRCHNALEAFDVLHQESIDLMFLDIKMPSISGIDFLRALKQPPAVIFTTAYSEYAVTGFELEAVDYLLKPITLERFQKAIDKFLKIRPAETPEIKAYTYFKVGGKLVKIKHTDLLLAQSVKDYIHLKTTHGNYLTHMTMKYLSQLLPPEIFVRVHRSYLINKSHITVINRNRITVGNEQVPVGENYRGSL